MNVGYSCLVFGWWESRSMGLGLGFACLGFGFGIAFGIAYRVDELAGDMVMTRMNVRLRMRISGISSPSSAMCTGERCSLVLFLGWD